MTYVHPQRLTRAFWRKYRHLVVITPTGDVRLTAPGRARFAYALAAQGYSAHALLGRSTFESVAARCATALPVRTEEDLMNRLRHDRLTPFERTLLAQVLAKPLPQLDEFRAPVVALNAWRVSRAA